MNPRLKYQIREVGKRVFLNFRKKPQQIKFPKALAIEINSICNAKCQFCAYNCIKRKKRLMDFNTFKKIINQCVGKPLEIIKPFSYGEPFLNKNIILCLRYIRKTLPQVKIYVTTNGSIPIPAEFLEERLADSITFSFNAMEKETYKSVMGLDMDNVLTNILSFLRKNKELTYPIHTEVSFVLFPANEKDLNRYKSFWKGKVDKVNIGSDDGKFTKHPYINQRKTKVPCHILFYEMFILSDGQVSFCCIDHSAEFPMGDINSQSIEQIWNSPLWNNLRSQHLNSKKDLNPICRDCFVTY